jgi:hypothetical protein
VGTGCGREQGVAMVITLICAGRHGRSRMTVIRHRAASNLEREFTIAEMLSRVLGDAANLDCNQCAPVDHALTVSSTVVSSRS